MPTFTRDANCALWRKSTRSGGAQQCVELARLPAGAAVRDSKHPDSALLFNPCTFDTFVTAIKGGTLDDTTVG